MRLYYGTYGHRLSGKLYCYWGDDNLRTGQQVVAPVTHAKSGKNYDTMFTIARVQGEKNAEGEVSRLGEGGIFIKTLGGRDLLALPGGASFSSKAEWKRDSDRRYRARWSLPSPAKASKTPTNATGKSAQARPKTAQVSTLAKPKHIHDVTPQKKKKPKRKKSKKARKKAFKEAQRLVKQSLGAMSKSLKKYAEDDKAMDAAKASLSKNNTAADRFKQRERLKEIHGREAFKE